MDVEFKYVEDIIKDELGIQCPEIDVCGGNPYIFTLMRPQFYVDFIYDEINGPVISDKKYNDLCRDLLIKAKKENIDVLLTPEYCISYDLILEIISDNNNEIKPDRGKLWCLCCQGIKYDMFLQYIDKCEELGAKIIRCAINNASIKNFVNALLYAFRLSDGSMCIIPQLKTNIMGDRELLCEGIGMCKGNIIYKFGKNNINQLCSIICADSLNSTSIGIDKINNGKEHVILLHPQLNERPRNRTFCTLRYILYDNTICDNLVYITANWAYGCKLVHSSNPSPKTTLEISNPWTCIYIKDASNNWMEKQRDLRKSNYSKGIGFGYFNSSKLKTWYAFKNELMHMCTIKKPKTTGPNATQPSHDVLVNKVYTRSEHGEWMEKEEINENDNLKDIVDIMENDMNYNFPIKAEKEVRDIFFGICLGNFEEGQLSIGEGEICKIISTHVDDECEEVRLDLVNNFNILVQNLKDGKLSRNLKSLIDSHKFSLEDNLYNLISNDGSVKTKAVVTYVPKEGEARKISEFLLDKVNKQGQPDINIIKKLISEGRAEEINDYLPDNYVCVFTMKRGTTKIISYPEYNGDITAPERIVNEGSILR